MTDDNKTQNNAGIYSSRMIRRLRQHSLEVVVGFCGVDGSRLRTLLSHPVIIVINRKKIKMAMLLPRIFL